jgi:hypothetical protein
MGLFKKKVDADEEVWKEEIKKEALKEARTEAAPKLKEKIKLAEVDRLTGDKKGKMLENLKMQFKPLGDLVSNDKMDRLLGRKNTVEVIQTPQAKNFARIMGTDSKPMDNIVEKGRNFRDTMGYDDIKADERVKRMLEKKK